MRASVRVRVGVGVVEEIEANYTNIKRMEGKERRCVRMCGDAKGE